MYALLWSKYQLITMNISLVFEFLAIFMAFILWTVKCFAQLCRTDPVDFQNPETLIFPMVHNMFLCKFFPGKKLENAAWRFLVVLVCLLSNCSSIVNKTKRVFLFVIVLIMSYSGPLLIYQHPRNPRLFTFILYTFYYVCLLCSFNLFVLFILCFLLTKPFRTKNK